MWLGLVEDVQIEEKRFLATGNNRLSKDTRHRRSEIRRFQRFVAAQWENSMCGRA